MRCSKLNALATPRRAAAPRLASGAAAAAAAAAGDCRRRRRCAATALPPSQGQQQSPNDDDDRGGGDKGSNAHNSGPSPSASASAAAARLPDLNDGVTWYCYTVLGLLWLVDFTPLGAALASGPGAAVKLAAFQGGVFFLPTVAYAASRGWDLRRTFAVAAPSGAWAAAGEELLVVGGLWRGDPLLACSLTPLPQILTSPLRPVPGASRVAGHHDRHQPQDGRVAGRCADGRGGCRRRQRPGGHSSGQLVAAAAGHSGAHGGGSTGR
jgi:hypothetical protein